MRSLRNDNSLLSFGRMQEFDYPISCGKFELGGEHTLTSINVFSHRMEFNWISQNLGTIYPKKDEVWALYTKEMLKPHFATPHGGASKPLFRLVHVLHDLGAETRPYFVVLSKMNDFRTVWRPGYEPGSIEPKYLPRFSHRVPAYQLQGNEGPSAVGLEGYWDVDPLTLPSFQSRWQLNFTSTSNKMIFFPTWNLVCRIPWGLWMFTETRYMFDQIH